ncbi:MAG: hypothetical protein ACE144_20760, partial [Thermodesulfobacteriota bacterium]
LRYRPESVKVVPSNGGAVKEEKRSQKREASGEKSAGGRKWEDRGGDPGEERKQARVWALSPAGQPVAVSIVLGITDGTASEVVLGDLKEGQELIVEETSKKSQTTNTSRPPFFPGIRK